MGTKEKHMKATTKKTTRRRAVKATMKAVRFHEYGGPEVLVYEDAPRPQAGAGEVLVRVHAAGVNPIDWKLREGYLKKFLDLPLPVIPGRDFSGIVEAVGPGAAGFKAGDEVYGRVDTPHNGTYAEYVAVPESQAALKPSSVDHVHAAAIPLASLAAWQALFDSAQLTSGQKALIHAAAGGVGSFAVQLAKWKGAYVIGTASRRNENFVRMLGADEVIDYETTRFEDVVHDVDVVLDTIGGDTQKRSWQVLRKGGILVSLVSPPSKEEADAHGARLAYFSTKTIASELAEIAALVDSGRLKAHVETILPLAEARHAHELSQAGHARGKIVLRVV